MSIMLFSCGNDNPWRKSSHETVIPADDLDENGFPDRLTDAQLSNAFINLPSILQSINATKLFAEGRARGAGVKIAVLDNGFAKLPESLGVFLPPNLQVEQGPKNAEQDTEHGTIVARVAYAVATGLAYYDRKVVGPTMYLLNANGWTNAEAAFRKAKELNVDYIVYSQIWEYGGNLDGTGFIDKVVSDVIASGIQVVTAAGNLAKSSFQSRLEVHQRYAVLPEGREYLRMRVGENSTNVKISLGWNDFHDDIKFRTKQDLDLELLDAQKNIVTSSAMIQDGIPEHYDEKRYSGHAREFIQTTLNAGTYYLRVPVKSRNFLPTSRFWLTAYGSDVVFENIGEQNSIFIPSDLNSALVVGAYDSAESSRSRPELGPTIAKPDVLSPSTLMIKGTGKSMQGTSFAAPIAAGLMSVMQSQGAGRLQKQRFLSHMIGAGKSGDAPRLLLNN